MLLARQYFAARGFEILNFGLEIQESFDFEFVRFSDYPKRLPRLVERLFAVWAGLPPPMNPQPLIGILPDIILQNLIEHARVLEDVFCPVAGLNQFQRWVEMQPMLLN